MGFKTFLVSDDTKANNDINVFFATHNIIRWDVVTNQGWAYPVIMVEYEVRRSANKTQKESTK